MTKINVERNRFISSYGLKFLFESTRTGTQGRNLRAGNEAETSKNIIYWLAFSYKQGLPDQSPDIAYREIAPLIINQAMSHKYSHGPIWWIQTLTWGIISSQVIVVSVKCEMKFLLDIFLIYISNVIPILSFPSKNTLYHPPSPFTPTYPLPLPCPCILLYWGIRSSQDQWPFLLLMTKKTILCLSFI